MAFGENVDPTAAIRAILHSYPFSVGLLRELLQNSDDARATKQVFLLDNRTHPTRSLYHPQLAEMQGPALLAYNNALFSDEDWEALQSIHRSSKKTDTSKIGKYGIGFRSCYHVTDGPQILSGTSLAILDPRHEFSSEGGVKFDFCQDPHVDQLSSFDSLLLRFSQGLQFTGSIIRLPLRTGPSNIGDKRVSPSDIHQLLMEFIDKEIRIALLFLERLTSIEVLEIDVHGNSSVLALSEISRSPKVDRPIGIDRTEITACICEVRTTTDRSPSTTEQWRIQHTSFSRSDVASRLSQRAGCDPTGTLSEHKLQPDVGLAIPLSIKTQKVHSGRLYTYLPLPLPTGFPVHIHSLFALTQSRQNLRNHEEEGIVDGSADSILVKWNQLLFDVYIPQAWTYLLTTLVKEDDLSEIFRAWPPAQANQNGDPGYWKNLPAALLKCVDNSGVPIWPLIAPLDEPRLPCSYLDLGSVVVAALEQPGSDVLRALAKFGLKITCPPAYIYELLGGNSIKLTPKKAHDILLQHIADLELPMNIGSLPVIVQYLIADGDLNNLVGLPLILLANDQRLSLNLRGSLSNHTMHEKNEFEIFGACDADPIALHLLDESVARILRTRGPAVLNVRALSPETVVRYLKMDPNPLGLILKTNCVNYHVVEWLSRFWTWMGSWPFKVQLYHLIKDLHLLPSVNGLKRTSAPIYTKLGVHPTLISSFSKLGIPFLHPDFSEPVQNIVNSFRRLSNLNNISDLLDSLDFDCVSTVQLDEEAARIVLKHFNHGQRGSLDYEQRRKLRKLPIFPVVQAGSRNTATIWGSIPDTKQVRSVFLGSLRILPVVQGTVFVDGSIVDSLFLKVLDPNGCGLSFEHDILMMALQHFAAQSVQTKIAFIEYMAEQSDNIPPAVLNSLRRTPFVVVMDGSLRSPEDIVDPKSNIAPLFLDKENRFPRVADSENYQETLIEDLRLLRVMLDTLTANIVMERIQFVASTTVDIPSRTMLSRRLLRLLYSSGFNCASLRLDPNLKWLPTQNGLLSPASCHDEGSHQRELFDHVLPPLDSGISISPSMKIALGWDKPLPIQVLVEQLSKVLDLQHDEAYGKMGILIKELGQRLRDLDDNIFHHLRTTVGNLPWIPVSDGKLVNTSHAVFSDASPLVGFYKIPFTFAQGGLGEFLLRMGCSNRPLLPAIIQDLKQYQEQPPTQATTEEAVLLLKLLPPDISAEQRKEIMVPDEKYNMRPLDSVCYNDIGIRASLIFSSNVHIAHHAIPEDLAAKLRIVRLGIKFGDLKLEGLRRDMGELPTTTIRNKLRDYTEHQFLTEFVANAADAQATEFGIFIDEYQNVGEGILSRRMNKFQMCPSLIIHNNATFTAKDFDGICNTGIGGKQERTDSIGQFGSGALTMFHFSEVVTIVSGNQVVFLNPAKDHLPVEDRVLSLPLDHVNKCYPDQLASLDAAFEFNKSSSFYNGTIFRLPLRNESHIGENSISRTTWTARTIEDEIIRPFLLASHEFLLFTKLQAIKFRRRDAAGTTSKEERISATRQDAYVDGKYCSEILHISHSPPKAASGGQKWNVVSTSVHREDISDYSPQFSEKYRLRSPIVAGIAAKLDTQDRALSGKFFSTLPLPVPNALPVHITAPFISSSERRQIRFDAYDTSESKYNQWLLESVIPPLYAFLLADLLRHHGHNKWWWPGTTEEGLVPKINQILVSAFYRVHLGETKFRVFLPKYAVHPLLPNEAVILNAGSPAVLKKVIKILKPPQLVSLPNRLRSSAIRNAKIGSVTPLFIKNEILRYTGDLTSQLSFAELQELLDFIRKNDWRDLIGLPLLPLADGTFTKFEVGSCCTETYLIWKPRQASNPVFLRNHLVHPGFHATPLLDLGLNVAKLSVSRIQQLIQEIVPQGDERSEMTPDDEEWIVGFWSEYPLFQLDGASLLHSISSFPLVRTMQRGRYVSISRCRDQSSVILSSSEESKLWDCLTQLELTVVNRYSKYLPQAVRKILQPSSTVDGFSPFHFDQVLSALRPSIARRFQRLNTDDHHFFAIWARSQIFCTSKDLLPDAKMLPIWSPIRKPSLFLPATDIAMLQPGVTSALVGPFINNIVVTEYSMYLIHLGLSPMSWSEIFNKLHFPQRILPHRDMQSYLRLLTAIVDRDPCISWVLVPNCNNVMCQSDTLYARDPLFLAAFGSVSRHFVAEAVRNLETRLKAKFGLKCQSQLDLIMFRKCASAFNDLDDLSGDRVQRADVIFQIYCQELPLRVNEGFLPWESLNSLKFIPRINGRSRWNKDVSGYVRNRDLPDIVAPKDIVIPKYEAIAWTQRVLSAAEPSQRLLIANPNFGHPTAEEVVRHLDRLVYQVSADYPQDPAVLRDLEETYTWLNEHSADAGVHMIQHHARKLFLNVANPKVMIWEWHSAEDLLLGAKEIMRNFHPVQKFLLSFKNLLEVSGVQQLTNATLPERTSGSGLEISLQSIRSVFCLMRDERQLTDVIFITDAEDDNPTLFYAHRAYLASCCDHFKDAFTNKESVMLESLAASEDSPVRISVEGHSSRCVEIVLDFLYKGVVGVITPHISELLEVMELSNYWGITSLHEKVQFDIIPLIDLLNVTDVEERAEIAQAHDVVGKCKKYKEDNYTIMEQVRSYEDDD